MNIQREREREKERQTDRQTDRRTDRHTNRHKTDKQQAKCFQKMHRPTSFLTPFQDNIKLRDDLQGKKRQWMRVAKANCLLASRLSNVPAACKCTPRADLLTQVYLLLRWHVSCRSNMPVYPVTVH